MSYLSFIVSVILPLMLTEGLNTGTQQLTALARDDPGSSKLCLCGLGQKDVGHFENLQW